MISSLIKGDINSFLCSIRSLLSSSNNSLNTNSWHTPRNNNRYRVRNGNNESGLSCKSILLSTSSCWQWSVAKWDVRHFTSTTVEYWLCLKHNHGQRWGTTSSHIHAINRSQQCNLHWKRTCVKWNILLLSSNLYVPCFSIIFSFKNEALHPNQYNECQYRLNSYWFSCQ